MRRRLLVGVLVIAVIALAGYGVGSYVLFESISPVAADCGVRASGGFRFQENTPAGWSLANPDDVDAVWPASSRTVDISPYLMPDFTEVAVPSRDPAIGPLSGWWVPGRTPDAPAVVVVHGHSACKKDHVVLLPAGMLHRAGFGVLLIDLRDMGDSPHQDGRFAMGTQEYLDVLGARDWIVATQGVPASRVGLLGTSMGATTVTIAAGMDATVAAAWEDSGVGEVNRFISEEIAFRGLPDALNVLVPGGLLIGRAMGFDPTSISPLAMAAAIGTRPFAVVHGQLDPHALPHQGTDLAAVVARSVPGYEAWMVPCAHHVEAAYCATAEYETRLAGFFSDALGAP